MKDPVSLPQSTVGKAAIYAALILLADTLVIGAASVVSSRNLVSYYTLLLLLEAAALLFVGGFRRPWETGRLIVTPGLEPISKRDWSMIIAGLFVLAPSFLLAYPLAWFSR